MVFSPGSRFFRVLVLISYVLLTTRPLLADAVCGDRFARLHKMVEDTYPVELVEHREALMRITAKHLKASTDRLPEKEFDQVLQALSNPEPLVSESAGGTAELVNGRPVYRILGTLTQNPVQLLIQVHETQHLADMIKPTAAMKSAIDRGVRNRKLEIRAFTRQREFLLDVIDEIGVRGLAKIINRQMGESALEPKKIEGLLELVLFSNPRKTQNPRILKAMTDAPALSGEELDALYTKVVSSDSAAPLFFQHRNIGDRSSYARFFLDLENYKTTFENEKKVLENTEKLLRLSEEKRETEEKLRALRRELAKSVAKLAFMTSLIIAGGTAAVLEFNSKR